LRKRDGEYRTSPNTRQGFIIPPGRWN